MWRHRTALCERDILNKQHVACRPALILLVSDILKSSYVSKAKMARMLG
jgi:hypothetical protein